MSHRAALSMLLRAAVLLLEAEEGEDASLQSECAPLKSGPSNGASPESNLSAGSGPANDATVEGRPGKRRKGTRPVYRPQGPVDEVTARRADEVLKRAGLLPATPRRK